MEKNKANFEINKKEIIFCLQITKHYFVKCEVSIDIKPKIANLIYERAMGCDFLPAVGMYGELLRCF